jgi:hypothetical protein
VFSKSVVGVTDGESGIAVGAKVKFFGAKTILGCVMVHFAIGLSDGSEVS